MEKILIEKEVRIPGTNVVLEQGDSIQLISEAKQFDYKEFRKIAKFEDWGDNAYLVPNKQELDKMIKYFKSCGFVEVKSFCADEYDIKDETNGKPGYNVFLASDYGPDSEFEHPALSEYYASVMFYHPDYDDYI